jgi:hypothetical protein
MNSEVAVTMSTGLGGWSEEDLNKQGMSGVGRRAERGCRVQPSGRVGRRGRVCRAGRPAEREVSRQEGEPSGKASRAGGQPAGR